MRVLHVPYSFYPDPPGGTEIYVASLARLQRLQRIEAIVAAPGRTEASYTHEAVPVFRFQMSKCLSLTSLYGGGDLEAALSFTGLLDRTLPDIVHLHAYTPAVSTRLVAAARQREIPTIFTYHTPTVSCVRGTLLLMGETVCNGQLDVRRCAKCNLHGKGMNPRLAAAVAQMPETLGRTLGRIGMEGGSWTALRMPELIAHQHAAFHRLMTGVDRVIAVCEWVRDLLLLNGVPEEKITLSRQGSPDPVVYPQPRKPGHGGLRLVFLGRLSPVKGLDTVIEAIMSRPKLDVQLDVYGVAQDTIGSQLAKSLSARCAGDARIRFFGPIAATEVASRLTDYDALIVPSRWLETGPLVIYEAFAAGLPVLGSNLGGIAELVHHEKNGLLAEPGSPDSWAKTIEFLAYTPGLLQRLRAGIAQTRTMEDVAGEMAVIYEAVIGRHVCN